MAAAAPTATEDKVTQAVAKLAAAREAKDQAKSQAGRLRLQASHVCEVLDNPSCITCLPDGNICVSDTGNHRLLILSSESGEIVSTFPPTEVVDESFSQRHGSATGLSSDQLTGDRDASPSSSPQPGHVARRGSHRAHDFGSVLPRTSNHDGTQLCGPRGLAADSKALYVADCYNSRVKKFALSTGELLATVGGYGDDDGNLRYPFGIALAPNGILYVADSGNARICAFNADDMSFSFSFMMQRGGAGGSTQSTPASPDALQPLEADPTAVIGGTNGEAPTSHDKASDNPLLVKWGSRYLASSSPILRSLKEAGVESPHDLQHNPLLHSLHQVPATQPRASLRPSGIAILHNEMYVCDAYSRRLQVFTLSGEFVRFIQPVHAEGTEKGKLLFINPLGVAAANGRIYVSDRRGDALHMLAPEDGRPVQYVPFLVNRPRGLAGVCSDSGGRIFVIDEMKNELHMLSMLQDDAPKSTSSGGASMPSSARSNTTTPRSSRKPTGTPRASAKGDGVAGSRTGTEDGAAVAADLISAAMNGPR